MTNILIESGKSRQNGTKKSFNGKFRDEYLAMSWLNTREHAKVLIDD